MSIDFGRPVLPLRIRGAFSFRLDVRVTAVVGLLLAAAVITTLVALVLGDYDITVWRVVQTVFGGGDAWDRRVVIDRRMPRALLALILGAALGVSGAIFQSLTRNPLGSPDVIGFNTGAYTGVLVIMVLFGGEHMGTAWGALIGGIVTALLVYLLAFKRGVQGFRLIIVGIAVSAVLASFNTWMILTADLDTAMSAAVWGTGSLDGAEWGEVRSAGLSVALVLVLLIPFATRMPMMEMGDDTARALGVRTEPTRLALIVLGVALTALATAAAGPIAFVALAAPQLAKRLARTDSVAMVPAAAMGALLLAVSDLIAQRLFAPTQLPVGIVTVSIGGVYLLWLLAREASRQ
ncbi:FecCD family ABC transporter permease [Gordonia sp. VNK21]|uniref:FecCD family ABC transporter permease n=1 Tax=Gordonia sp. VNK21 TaxID=3382483 RepID=UPI0038D46564